jgi:hypothetical protein
MTMTISTEHHAARLEGTRAFLDEGANPASVRIYSGIRPITPADTPTSAMLVEVKLTKPCGSVINGQLLLTPQENALIALSGVATWARIVTGAEITAMDLDCSGLDGTAEIRLAQTQLYAGGYAQMANAALG